MMSLQRPSQLPVLPGFEHVNRYWDRKHNCWAAKILPGEYYVTTDPAEIICTTLGSCVSACVRDVDAGVAGMNHFMLPLEVKGSSSWMNMATRYGSAAMEYLINEMLKLGARKETLEVKLVGGGKILRNMSDIGRLNIDFVLHYAEVEGLNIVARDLGDIYPRKVIFHPHDGRMRVKRLKTLHNETLLQREQHYVEELQSQPESGEVELFQQEFRA